MEIRKDYIINEETILLTGEYNQLGKLCTRVIEGANTFLVEMAPIALMNKTLLRQGCTFQGALKSSRFLLGPMKMYPIKINAKLGIWLFPTKSYKKENCVWLAVTHVKDSKTAGMRKTEVCLSFGHTITIEMKQKSFKKKQQNAEELRKIILKNLNTPLVFYVEPKQGFYIREDRTMMKVIKPENPRKE